MKCFDDLFDSIDIRCVGYVTTEQVYCFCGQLEDDYVDWKTLIYLFSIVCGKDCDGKCHRDHFKTLLVEIERSRKLVEQLTWDFKALDADGDGLISSNRCLFLFKTMYGNEEGQRTWTLFNDVRCNRTHMVSFYHLKEFLRTLLVDPIGINNHLDEGIDNSIDDELRWQSEQREYDLYKQLQSFQEDDISLSEKQRKSQDNALKLKQSSASLLLKIERKGLEALLDGSSSDEDGSHEDEFQPKHTVSAVDILDFLMSKYDLLSKKLLLEMLMVSYGVGLWSALPSDTRSNKLNVLHVDAWKLKGTEQGSCVDLPGGNDVIEVPYLKSFGCNLPVESEAVASKGDETVEASANDCYSHTEVLDTLYNDRQLEKSRLLSSITKETMTVKQRQNHYLLLLIQLERIKNEKNFLNAVISIRITEALWDTREIPSQSNTIHQMQLHLAKKRLENRRGVEDIDQNKNTFRFTVEGLGLLDHLYDVITIREQVHVVERQWMQKFLYGKDSIRFRMDANRICDEERRDQLKLLNAQHDKLKLSNEAKEIVSVKIKKILFEATALVVANRKARDKSKMDPTVSLMFDLQLKQDQNYNHLFKAESLNNDQCVALKRSLYKSYAKDELMNVANVLFGDICVDREAETVTSTLDEKYQSLRMKILLDVLKTEYKEHWSGYSNDEKAKRLMTLKVKEKRMRDTKDLLGLFHLTQGVYDGIAADLQMIMSVDRQSFIHHFNTISVNDNNGGIDESDFQGMFEGNGHSLSDLWTRQCREITHLLQRLKSSKEGLASAIILTELVRLRSQKRYADQEHSFVSAAITVGLFERNQNPACIGLKRDIERHQLLAQDRLTHLKTNKFKVIIIDSFQSRTESYSESCDGVMMELENCHRIERACLAQLLLDNDADDLRQEAVTMSANSCLEQMSKLSLKLKELDLSFKDDRDEYWAILEMAAAIKYSIAVKKFKNKSQWNLESICVELLVELQLIQHRQYENFINTLKNNDIEYIKEARLEFIRQRKIEVLVNVTELLFRYDGICSDDEIVEAVEAKHNALMDKLIIEALQKQIGDAQWQMMSERERQEKLLNMRLEQKKLMKNGRFDEAARLLGDGFKAVEHMESLMEDKRRRCEEELKDRLAQRQKLMEQGKSSDDVESEIDHLKAVISQPITTASLLEDMQRRFDEEKRVLLSNLQGADKKFLTEQQRQNELMRLRRERQSASREEKYDTASLVMILSEQNKQGLEAKNKINRERQEALARKRIEMLKARQSSKRDKSLPEISLHEDITTQQNSALKHVQAKHDKEREALLNLLQSISGDATNEVSDSTTQSERESQLAAIRIKIKSMDSADSNYSNLLKEAAALKAVFRYQSLKENSQSQVTDNVIQVSLLADIQVIQDNESSRLFEEINVMDIESLIELQRNCLSSDAISSDGNCLAVIMKPEQIDVVTETVLIDALRSQYDVLRDRLILEGLEVQLGEAEWARLSEQERQEKLLKIRLKEKMLRKEGKMDELERLFMTICSQQKHVHDVMGESRALQEQRLKERLVTRKERAAKGLSEIEIDSLEKEDDARYEAAKEELKKKNPLLQLQENYDAECAAVLASFRGANTCLSTERDRQMELSRLRRNERMAKREDKFDAVAMVIGLANRQSNTLKQKVNTERMRQEQLAKERLANRRKLRHSPHSEGAAIVSDDPFLLRELLIKDLDAEHEAERGLFVDLLGTVNNSTVISLKRSKDDRLSKRSKLMECLDDESISLNDQNTEDTSRNCSNEHNDNARTLIYRQALGLVLEEFINEQIHDDEDDDEKSVIIDKTAVNLLADLQEQQDKEMKEVNESMLSKDIDELQSLMKINQSRSQSSCKHLIQLLLGKHLPRLDSTSDAGLLQALEMKYDLVQEKIIIDILIKKYTAEVWEQLSVSEQQSKIKEFISQQSTVDWSSSDINVQFGLVGDDALGAKGTNPFDTLKDQFEEEKAALLASLQAVDNKMENEWERQRMLAKLKRDRLMLKREQNVENVALVFSIAKDNYNKAEQNMEREKARQLKLAQLRLTARRKAMKSKPLEDSIKSNEKAIVDSIIKDSVRDENEDADSSELKSREVVLMEMNLRHTNEIDNVMHGIEAARLSIDIGNENTTENYENRMDSIRGDYQRLKGEAIELQKQFPTFNGIDEIELNRYVKEVNQLQKKSMELQVSLLIAIMKSMKDIDNDTIDANILASVQRQQQIESNTMPSVLINKEINELHALKVVQRSLRYCQLPENLIKSLTDQEQGDDGVESIDAIDIDAREKLTALELELEETKQQKRIQGMTEDEIDHMMKDLREQHDRNAKNVRETAERQKKATLLRMQKMKRQKEAKLFEEDIAASLMMAANQQMTLVREKTAMVFTKQKDSLEKRLRERIALKRKKDEAEIEAAATDYKEGEEKDNAKSRQYSLPEGMGLRREKTVVEEAAQMEESTKKEIVGFLMKEQTGVALKMQKEQQRQEDRVRSIRSKLKKRMEDREQEAATLIGHVERQKTIVLNNQKEERNRQITTIRERVARIKYERTMTQKDTASGGQSRDGFLSLMEEENGDGLSKDEAMVRVAERIEKHLREEQQKSSQVNVDGDAELESNAGSVPFDDKLKEMQYKERFAKRRKSRHAAKREVESHKIADQGNTQDI